MVKFFLVKFNLSDSELAILKCQLQSSFLTKAREDCPNVPGEIGSIIGSDSIIIHVMSTLAALTTGSKYLRMKLKKADTDLLRLC